MSRRPIARRVIFKFHSNESISEFLIRRRERETYFAKKEMGIDASIVTILILLVIHIDMSNAMRNAVITGAFLGIIDFVPIERPATDADALLLHSCRSDVG